jgi:hypothetical protein
MQDWENYELRITDYEGIINSGITNTFRSFTNTEPRRGSITVAKRNKI